VPICVSVHVKILYSLSKLGKKTNPQFTPSAPHLKYNFEDIIIRDGILKMKVPGQSGTTQFQLERNVYKSLHEGFPVIYKSLK
jgi:hypothetical protein